MTGRNSRGETVQVRVSVGVIVTAALTIVLAIGGAIVSQTIAANVAAARHDERMIALKDELRGIREQIRIEMAHQQAMSAVRVEQIDWRLVAIETWISSRFARPLGE
ncbi:MAG TPA: hypothetical protein PKC43_06215 [Phycisphaerales bacterium]|nr:hypothetical protein [Phycisphaerales bacterium]HMP37026.1 hypothetical protein [Phycisphaerales bacterium]